MKLPNFCAEVMNSTQQKLDHIVQILLPLAINVTLNLFIIIQLWIESFDVLNSITLNVEKPDARTRYTTRQGAKKIIFTAASIYYPDIISTSLKNF